LDTYNVHQLPHYLDDFLTAGSPESTECQQNFEAMLHLCQQINIPIKPEKVVTPTTKLTILIDIATVTVSKDEDRKAASLELQLLILEETQENKMPNPGNYLLHAR